MSPEAPWRPLAALLPLLFAVPAGALAQDPTVKGFDGVLTGEVGPAKPAPKKKAAPPPIASKPAWGGNYRPSNRTAEDIDMIVIHKAEGTNASGWFANEQSEVSAHYDVRFDGTIWQSVDVEDVAWHAGDSDVNGRSIGIEHDGLISKQDTTEAQYDASARLVAWLCSRYGIPIDRDHIIGHSEVNGTGGANGHTDPGKHWDWGRYMALVKKYAGGEGGAGTGEEAPGTETPGTGTGTSTTATPSAPEPPSPGEQPGSLVTPSTPTTSTSAPGPTTTPPPAQSTLPPPPAPPPTPTPTPEAAGDSARVKPPGLNVRSGPGSGYAAIAEVNAGEVYPVLERRGSWTRIQVGSRQGWCYEAFLESTSAPVRRVTATYLKVRAGPGAVHPVLGALRQDARVSVVASAGEWRQVWFQGRPGWVSASYLAE